jgi:hypothetical protein
MSVIIATNGKGLAAAWIFEISPFDLLSVAD